MSKKAFVIFSFIGACLLGCDDKAAPEPDSQKLIVLPDETPTVLNGNSTNFIVKLGAEPAAPAWPMATLPPSATSKIIVLFS